MPVEVLGAIASIITAVVVGATAIAALVQLRHIRASNELTAFTEAFELWYSESTQRGLTFLQTEYRDRMQDPRVRAELDSTTPTDHTRHPELYVLDFFDNIAVMVVLGMLRESVILLPASQLIVETWELMNPAIAIMRRRRGQQLWISFEYLVHRAKIWIKRYPHGYALPGWARLPNPDVWAASEVGATTTSSTK